METATVTTAAQSLPTQTLPQGETLNGFFHGNLFKTIVTLVPIALLVIVAWNGVIQSRLHLLEIKKLKLDLGE